MSEKLTIAQGLRKIKKLKGLLAEAQQRAIAGVSFNQEKKPAFNYLDSQQDMFSYQDQLVNLEARVAIANANNFCTVDEEKLVLAKAVRLLQEYKGRIAFLKALNLKSETEETSNKEYDLDIDKYVTKITKTIFVSELSEKDRDTQVKFWQEKFELLNNAVENANHITLLSELS